MARRNTIDRRGMLAGAALMTVAASNPAGAAAASARKATAEIWQHISEVLQNYADSLDRCDPEAFGAVFTADGVFDYKPDTLIQRRPALVAAARSIFAGVARSSHHVGPPVVTGGDEPEQWRVRSYFSAHHLLTTGKRLTLHGRYEDLFAPDRSDGVLLIAYRKVIGHVAEDGMEGELRHWLRPLVNK